MKEKGITLIALIITIIVMLIIVGITINAALNGGVIGKAQDAKAQTEEAMANEESIDIKRVKIDGVWYDSVDDYINGAKSKNQNDSTLVIVSMECPREEKQTDSLTIKVKAEDYEADNLTYKLSAGESAEKMEYNSEPVSAEQGTEATLTVNGLKEFTEYYYKVEVSDGKLTVAEVSENAERTFCSGEGFECERFGISMY